MKAENVCQLPISRVANEANDSGVPLSISRPDDAGAELSALEDLAKIVSKEIFHLPYRSDQSQTTFKFEGSTEEFDISTIQLSKADDESLILRAFSDAGALQLRISPGTLRNRDPRTGASLGQPEPNEQPQSKQPMVTVHRANSSPTEVTAERIEKKAKVGFEITWSDGSKFIYSRTAIAVAAGGTKVI